MSFSKLKKAIVAWMNQRDEPVYANDAAKKFKVSRDLARKAFAQLHNSGEMVCADGDCEKCDG